MCLCNNMPRHYSLFALINKITRVSFQYVGEMMAMKSPMLISIMIGENMPVVLCWKKNTKTVLFFSITQN